jgi:hypothetical protein
MHFMANFGMSSEETIFEQAKVVAKSYDPVREWEEWSVNAREDFWEIACEDLNLPVTPLPDEYAETI